ncbi:MAG: hypothetical protein DDT21_00318 [Syntrophomonadaceae bacterium]|nr:hypothetical protein [Bacillota bacterium]
MEQLGRILLMAGAVLLLLGVLFTLGARFGLGRLPGDIIIRRENFVLFFPLMSGLVLSLVLSLLLFLWHRLR